MTANDFANKRSPMTGYELEYRALRTEMDKRMEWRNQIIFTLIAAAGAILGFGFQAKSTLLILLYPPIAALLATLWAQNDIRIIQLGKYIREDLEPVIGGMHWQQRRREHTERPVSFGPVPYLVIAGGGFFILSQVFPLGAALREWAGSRPPDSELSLFVVGVVGLVFTIYLVVTVMRWGNRR